MSRLVSAGIDSESLPTIIVTTLTDGAEGLRKSGQAHSIKRGRGRRQAGSEKRRALVRAQAQGRPFLLLRW